MPDRQTIERVVRAAYAARGEGDVAGMMDHLTPDASFRIAGSNEASPIPCRVDAAACGSALRTLVDFFDFVDHELVDLVVEGDRAVAHWRVRVRARATGETADTELLDLMRFEGDRIASFTQFCDTAMAAKLLGTGAMSEPAPTA